MVSGYAGKVLYVDLTQSKTWVEEPKESFYRRYLGGSGFVGYYLLKEVPKGADPLGPENALIFAAGTVTGMPVAGAGRSAVGGKSPLTGGYGEGDVGGFFGAEMKRAGFDAVIVKGKAAKPVYLWLNDGQVEIKDASHLWGTTTLECQTKIQEELGDSRVRMAMIGPGGEKMVRVACVINDLRHSAGRTGLGAVMGSKNLKAVVARGKASPPAGNEEKFRELAKFMRDTWKERAYGLYDTGTDGGLEDLSEFGALPTRNFQDGQFEGAHKLTGATMRDTILVDREGCYACPVRCKRVVSVDDADYKVDRIYGGPEYETMAAFGSNCGVDDIRAVAKAHEICNAYSLDTIGAGMMVSFAMECYENGLITKADTGGLELNFGNGKAMVELTQMLAERKGIGDLLAEGPKIAAARIGKGAEMYAIQVKGQPFPMHECRTRHGQALGYAVSPTGADHVHNYWDGGQEKEPLPEDLQSMGIYEAVPQTELNSAKVRAYIAGTNGSWLNNQLGICAFVPWRRDELVELIRSITGWQTNVYELMKSVERGVTMARVFNLREGFSRKDDVLPLRMNTPHKSGTVNEKPVDPEVLDEHISLFYAMSGWDPQTGVPTAGKLAELDIEWAGESLK